MLDVISEIMSEKGISIEKLKQEIENQGGKLSRTSISNIINGKTTPKIDTLQMIAKALEVPVAAFFAKDAEIIHLIIKNELKTFYSINELKNFISDF